MSESELENLIDLSAVQEDKISHQENLNEENNGDVLTKLSLNSTNGRDSLENNPFDKALKLADMDDPFESVFYEARNFSKSTDVEVETGNLVLLPLNDTELGLEQTNKESQIKNALAEPKFNRIGSTDSNHLSSISSINSLRSPSCLDNGFDSESLQLSNASSMTLNKGFLTENTILSEFSDDSSNIINKGFIISNTIQESSISGSELKIQSCEENYVDKNSVSSTDTLSENLEKSHAAKKEVNSLLKLSLTNGTISPLNQSRNSNSSDKSMSFEANNLAQKLSNLVTVDPQKDDSCDDIMSIKPNWLDTEVEVDSDLEMLKIPMLEKIDQGISVPEGLEEDNPSKLLEDQNCLVNSNCVNVNNSKPVSSRRSVDLNDLKQRIELEKQKNEEHASESEVSGLIQSLKNIVLECSNDNKKAEANNLLESLSNILAKRSERKVEIFVQPPTPPQKIVRQGTFDLERSNLNSLENETEDNSGNERLSQGSNKLEISSQNFQTAVPEILEQIGKIFGNENINVVQTNLGNTCSSINPTYIVVLGSPAPQACHKAKHNNIGDGSPEFTFGDIRHRSQSLSLHDKESRLQKDKSPKSPLRDYKIRASSCQTPRPNLLHRKSIISTPHNPNLSCVRRSIYGPKNDLNNDDTSQHYQSVIKRTSVLQTHREVDIPSKTNASIKPEIIPKKWKVKSTEIAPKLRGPLKAIIPAKKMAPMIVSTTVPSPIEDKKKKKPTTSTPIIVPITSQLHVPNACSTPAVKFHLSPAKNISNPRTRYSFVSTTPKPKSNIVTTTSFNRRRSLSELKSPRRGLDSVRETGIGKAQIKTIKLPQDFVKTVNTLGTGKITRPFKRESLLEKNKENKIPRAAAK